MNSQLTNQKKSLRRSVRVITPDQIKKLGLDVTLRNLITRQTGIQNSVGNLEKAENNTITKAKLKISIHKSNDVDETVSQQVNESPKSIDSIQKSSRRISTKNSVNIIKATRNRANLKGSNESVSDDNCNGENSPSRKLRSNAKADNTVKPQNVDLNIDKTIKVTDKINLKETRECNLIAHQDITIQPTNPADNFVKDDHLENINPSEVTGKKKSESFKERDINFKVNEDTNSESLKKPTTDGVSRCEENKSKIKLPTVPRKNRISSEAVNKIKLSRNNKKKEEFENVAANKKDEISCVDEQDQTLIKTPSIPNLNKSDMDEPSKIDVSKENTNENIDLPRVSRISSEALNKMSLIRNNRKKEKLELEDVDEKSMKVDDTCIASSNTAASKIAGVEKSTIVLENVEGNIGKNKLMEILNNPDLDTPNKIVTNEVVNGNPSNLPSGTRNKRISSEALNKFNLRRNNDVLNKSLEVKSVDENVIRVNQKEIEPLNKSTNVDITTNIDVVENGLNESTSKINLVSASRKKKISTEALNKINSRRNNNKKKEIVELENIVIEKAMEMDQSQCVEQQHQSSIAKQASKSASLNIDAVENDANEYNNVNLPSVSRNMRISCVALNRNNKKKETAEIENVIDHIGIETPMEVNSPWTKIKDKLGISIKIIEKSTEIAVIEKNMIDNTSNIHSPSEDRKKRFSSVALNEVNLNSKNKKIFVMEDVKNVGTEKPMDIDEISCVEKKDESFIGSCGSRKKSITNNEMKLIRNNSRKVETIDKVSIEDVIKPNIENIEEVESSDDDNRLVIDEHTSNDKLNESLIVESSVDSANLNISTEIITNPKKKVETNIALNDSLNQNNSNDLETRRTSRKTRNVNTSNVARSSKRNSINKTKDIVIESGKEDATPCQINEGLELPEIKRKSENKEDNLFMQLEGDKVLKEDSSLNTRTLTIEVNLEENKKTEVRCSKRTSLRRKQDKPKNACIDYNLQQASAVLGIDDTFSDKSNYKESQVLKSDNEEPAKPEIKGTLTKITERTDNNLKVRNTNNKLKESLIKSDSKESHANVSINEINKCDEKRISRTPKVTASRKNAIGKGLKDNESKPLQKKITDFLFLNEKPDSEKNVGKSRKRKASSDIIECETDQIDHAIKDTSADDVVDPESQKDKEKVLKNKRAKSKRKLLKENESDNETINVAEPAIDTANVQNDELKPKGNKRKRSNISKLDNPSKKFKEDSLENLKNDEGESIIEIYNTSNQQKKLIELYSVELKQMYAELLKKPGRKFGKISGTVVCALCNQSFISTLWTSHKLKHNNIAWRVGEEPMSLEPSAITTVLNAMYKGRKKICCHKCTDSKKSVFGFLCHFIVCGKNDYELDEMKVPCEVCGTKILPCLYLFHFKIHLKAEKNVSSIVTEPNDISSESPRKARVAAKKANVMIESVSKYLDGTDDGYFVKNVFKKSDFNVVLNKEISSKGFVCCPFEGCEVKLENVDKILKHLEECPHKPEEVYMCKKCFHCNKVRADMINHVQEHQKQKKRKNDDGEFNANASDSNEETDYEDSKSSTTTSKNKNGQSISKFCNLAFLGEKFKKKYLHGVLCNRNYMWMLQFCQDNFNDKKLFMKFAFSSKYVNVMDPKDISSYLPKIKRSINMQQNIKDFGANKLKSNQNCKKYKLFETESNKTSTNIYCGGQITATIWAPTPYDADTYNQVLAVALNLDVNKSYTFTEINTDKGLLQFWSFGNMNSGTLKEVLEPELAFCIGHNYGYVTSMEWCPSGCYDEDRLGLLCICCSDSFVYGLPVSQPSRVTSKMLNAKPAFKLSLSKWRDMDLGDCIFHPTTISWSKSAGHKYIAIGYSNGVVALFDLTTESELLRKQDDDLQVYFPYKTFLAHGDIVTSLQLYHLNGGNRWLVTGSNDRMVKFWDLQQTAIPIYINQRTYVSQLLWPINYIGTIDAHNDFLNSVLQTTTVSHIRDFANSINNVLMYTGTSVNSISCNEWSSIIVQGNEMGEVIGCHFDNFFSNSAPKKFYISNIGLEGKLASNNNDSTVYPTYKDVCDNFNVVFNDYDMQFYFNVIKKSDALVGNRGLHSSPKPNIFPIQAVTQISVNPNRYSYYYIAAGYKLGFVKIFKMKMFQSN